MADKYTSTLLPQDNSPLEIQKGVLDLLKKINEVSAENKPTSSSTDSSIFYNPVVFAGQAPNVAAGNFYINYTAAQGANVLIDTANAMVASTGTWTCPEDGSYRITVTAKVDVASEGRSIVNLYLNNVAYGEIVETWGQYSDLDGSYTLTLSKGDTIRLYRHATVSKDGQVELSIIKLQTTATLTTSSTILEDKEAYFQGRIATSGTITASQALSITTESYKNMYPLSTGITVTVPGRYYIYAQQLWAATSAGVSVYFRGMVNGVTIKHSYVITPTAGSNNQDAIIGFEADLVAGDVISFYASISGGTWNCWSAEHSSISIFKMGNPKNFYLSTTSNPTVQLYNLPNDVQLAVGQSGILNTSLTQSTTLPLHVACASGQMYELTVLHRKPQSAANFDLSLYPNNTTYSNAFFYYGIVTSSTASVFTSSTTGSSFYFDDMSGSCNAPYIRKIYLFTGDANNSPTAMEISGGGYGSGAIGLSHYAESWNTISPVWTSLGTLAQTPSAAWSVIVTRLI